MQRKDINVLKYVAFEKGASAVDFGWIVLRNSFNLLNQLRIGGTARICGCSYRLEFDCEVLEKLY
jgi:hypothetical protein